MFDQGNFLRNGGVGGGSLDPYQHYPKEEFLWDTNSRHSSVAEVKSVTFVDSGLSRETGGAATTLTHRRSSKTASEDLITAGCNQGLRGWKGRRKA